MYIHMNSDALSDLGQRLGVLRQLALEALPVPLVEALRVGLTGVVDHDDLLQVLRGRVVQHLRLFI